MQLVSFLWVKLAQSLTFGPFILLPSSGEIPKAADWRPRHLRPLSASSVEGLFRAAPGAGHCCSFWPLPLCLGSALLCYRRWQLGNSRSLYLSLPPNPTSSHSPGQLLKVLGHLFTLTFVSDTSGSAEASSPVPAMLTLALLAHHSRPYRKVACELSCFSHVRLSAVLWTIARQAPPSMGFSTQE